MLGHCEFTQENAMTATRNTDGSAVDPDESAGSEIPPTPDEDGPHDVPDETVIEKTLPKAPLPTQGGSRNS
jgi:hypothetical protein